MPELTNYEADNSFWGDRIPAKEYIGFPSILYVREVKEGLTTEYTPDGDGRAVVCDVVNLTNGEISINVHWFTGALVDGLKRYVGGKILAVKFENRKGAKGMYPSPVALTDSDLAYANSWLNHNPNVVAEARLKREAEEGVSAAEPPAPTLPVLSSTPPPPVPHSAPPAPPATPPPPMPPLHEAKPGAMQLPGDMSAEERERLLTLLSQYGQK